MNKDTIVMCIGEDDVEIEVTFTWYPIADEVVIRLPEDCSPRDGGLQEITSITLKGVEILSILSENTFFSEIEERLERVIEEMRIGV